MAQPLIVSESYIEDLVKGLNTAKSDRQLFKAIVNGPFNDRPKATMLGLGIVVLLLVEPQSRLIERIALSDTELARGTVAISVKPFKSIKIPLLYKGNLIAEAIRSGRYQQTSDWQYLFTPALNPEEARLNQAGGGIACSFVYPLIGARSGGAMIFSYFVSLDRIGQAQRNFMERYSRMVSRSLKQ